MEKSLQKITVTNIRDMRFGEILVVVGDSLEIYNTTGLNDCPAELWNALDFEEIKKQFGAVAVQKNGPKFWMMDSQAVLFGEKVSFGGLEARWAGRADAALARKSELGSEPYKLYYPKKTQYMVYEKGKPVFELVDPEGHTYVMQAHGPQFPFDSLA
ncbi:hypothetical protein L0244_29855, partial [bacterium]|nr:hypothetical protein [bacterium]